MNEEKKFVIIGKIEDTFGVDGKLKVKPFSPQRVWENTNTIYLKRKTGEYVPFEVEKAEVRGRKVYLKLKGIDSEDDALRLSGAHIFLPEEELPKLKSGEYYYYQLVGSKVVGRNGEELGTVDYIHDGGMYPMLVLDNNQIIPFTKNFVVKVDPENKTIVVDEEKIPKGE
jgi:16S rRNA processing protein RimM